MNNIKQNLRVLFTTHSVYTKFFIESVINDIEDIGVITTNLLSNQKDIGNYLKQFIGNENGNRLIDLLTQHILSICAIIICIKNSNDINSSLEKTNESNKSISLFFSSLKLQKKLIYNNVLKIFTQHTKYIVEMAKLHFDGKYVEQYKTYDNYYNHMMIMVSDVLSNTFILNAPQIK